MQASGNLLCKGPDSECFVWQTGGSLAEQTQHLLGTLGEQLQTSIKEGAELGCNKTLYIKTGSGPDLAWGYSLLTAAVAHRETEKGSIQGRLGGSVG